MFPFWEKKVLDLVQLDSHWWKMGRWSQIQKTEGHFPRHQEHNTQSKDAQYFWKQLEHTHDPNEKEGRNDITGQISISSKELYIPMSTVALTL